MSITQGARANAHGGSAEGVINSILQAKGYRPERQRLVGSGIFGTPIHVDFYLASVPGYANGLIVESKWQEVPGTADEKLPYLVANIHHCFPCPTIIVLHGGGFRAGAERWLRSQVDGFKLIAVLRLEEFLTWCNRNL